MGVLPSLREIEQSIESIARGDHFARPEETLSSLIDILTPADDISVTECAVKHRRLPNEEGGYRHWSAALTPYICGIQDAMDDPDVRMVAVVGPARTGKTVAPENWLLKRAKYGPLESMLWYLPSDTDRDEYWDKTALWFLEGHPDIAAKLSADKRQFKKGFVRIDNATLSWLPANTRTTRGRQAPIIIGDEIDVYQKALRTNFVDQIRRRQRAYGTRAKAYVCSHPDLGESGGIYPAYLESTCGRWYWACPSCGDYSSPNPGAKWKMALQYDRIDVYDEVAILDEIERTAHLLCPHCGTLIENAHKAEMLLTGKWVFDGQDIDLAGDVTGAKIKSDTEGFWIHGVMSPFITWGKLARLYMAAVLRFEKDRDYSRLRESVAKDLGEVPEGGDARNRPVDADELRERLEDPDHRLGIVPAWARFIVGTVDPGGKKFDIQVTAFGDDEEFALVDRYTVTQLDGRTNVEPPLRIDDWMVVYHQLIKKTYPIEGRDDVVMQCAAVGMDSHGTPGTTWKAREFARRMRRRGINGRRLWLFKGASTRKAQLMSRGPEINVDEDGNAVRPPVREFSLNTMLIKDQLHTLMQVDKPGPGYFHMPVDAEERCYRELTAERLVGDKWERRGDNETWDLTVYAIALRDALRPDKHRDWSKPPAWARWLPIVQGHDDEGEPAPVVRSSQEAWAAKKKKLLERMR